MTRLLTLAATVALLSGCAQNVKMTEFSSCEQLESTQAQWLNDWQAFATDYRQKEQAWADTFAYTEIFSVGIKGYDEHIENVQADIEGERFSKGWALLNRQAEQNGCAQNVSTTPKTPEQIRFEIWNGPKPE